VRILHAIQEMTVGGAERVVLALAAAARSEGHTVAVAAAPGQLTGELDGLVFELPLVERRLGRVPAAIVALRGAIRAFRPDLVHCHNPGIAAAAGPATLRGRTPPGLVSVHGVPDEDYGRAARVLRLAGLPVVACGPGVGAGLHEAGLQPLTTILNGVPPAPAPADRAALRKELGIPAEGPLVLAVGRLAPVKNHALAIRALADVPEAVLAVVGDGPLLDELRARAAREGVAGRVVFTGVRPDARALIGAADAVVLPSHAEGLPLVALEALAAGTPLVATDVRGVRELVADGAELVPPNDAAALAEALRRVLADRSLAAGLAQKGLSVAREHSEERMAKEYLELYGRLAAPG
jgi:glycosyltransferase involved in cell wall biosynthesis